LHIDASALTTFEVDEEGARLRICAEDAHGRPVSMSLPSESLRQMMMTLPRLAQTALRHRYRDDRMRVVYPQPRVRIELGSGPDEMFIVTLSTQDGYEVSFGLKRSELASMERMLRAAGECRPAPDVIG
jgi:hypothetical protein